MSEHLLKNFAVMKRWPYMRKKQVPLRKKLTLLCHIANYDVRNKDREQSIDHNWLGDILLPVDCCISQALLVKN